MSQHKRRISWHQITDQYEPWVDDLNRIKTIFDVTGRFRPIYDRYGYNSDLVTVSEADDREEVQKAKDAWSLRQLYLKTCSNLDEFSNVYQLMVANGMDEGKMTEAVATSIANHLVEEVNRFLMYKYSIYPGGENTTGFCFKWPNTNLFITAWRDGRRYVDLQMLRPRHGSITVYDKVDERKEIFKVLKKKEMVALHQLFNAHKRCEVLQALEDFLVLGWLVFPLATLEPEDDE